jgi:hypothetical protein
VLVGVSVCKIFVSLLLRTVSHNFYHLAKLVSDQIGHYHEFQISLAKLPAEFYNQQKNEGDTKYLPQFVSSK